MTPSEWSGGTGGSRAGSVNTADHLLERGEDDAVALVEGGRRHSYRTVREAASRLSAALADLDLPAGARVGLLAPNSLFWVAGYLATMKLGLVVVPLADKLTPREVRRNLDTVGGSALLATRRSLQRVADALPAGLPRCTEDLLTQDTRGYWPDPLPVDPDADAALMFTSGSTARPKAVRITHRNIQANTASILEYLGLRADDRALVILPFHYCYGASLLHTHLRTGARLVLCNSFVYPETVLDLLEREECTVLAGVPSSFHLLLRAGSFASRALPTLRLVQQAGGRMPEASVSELVAAAPDARIFLMYGQTEATARLSSLPPELVRRKPGSIGQGIPGVRLQVLDDTLTPVPPGQVGEIYATGESISPGYWGDAEGSAAKFTPQGLRTGDLAVLDEDGDITVVDRRDEFIKTWGYRVSSHEIEDCALRMPELVAAAAIGVPDPRAGEAIVLFAAIRPGARITPEDVAAFCGGQLPGHMVPRRVVLLDTLPLTANGKVARTYLRDLAPTTSAAPPSGALEDSTGPQKRGMERQQPASPQEQGGGNHVR